MFQLIQISVRAGTVFLVSLALAVSSAQAADAQSVLGNWSTEGGHGVVAIEQCGDALCGRLVGLDIKPDEPIPTDVHGTPECGLTLISNERPTGDGSWLGEIIDPRTGRAYDAKIWIDDAGDLHLRGFLGIPLFGETQIWHHFTGRLTDECRLT
jgi:uncharacterized protein (DUF2147 family)